ncbi:hypothetical protein FB451DRAFT_1375581 [Mycena latifolia]|nr:hypothetical protein FB451DRAFT_1375581 [Mycena latifolia]
MYREVPANLNESDQLKRTRSEFLPFDTEPQPLRIPLEMTGSARSPSMVELNLANPDNVNPDNVISHSHAPKSLTWIECHVQLSRSRPLPPPPPPPLWNQRKMQMSQRLLSLLACTPRSRRQPSFFMHARSDAPDLAPETSVFWCGADIEGRAEEDDWWDAHRPRSIPFLPLPLDFFSALAPPRPSKRKSIGCGAAVHTSAHPAREGLHWVGCVQDAELTVLPLEPEYFAEPQRMVLELGRRRCGCAVEDVRCAIRRRAVSGGALPERARAAGGEAHCACACGFEALIAFEAVTVGDGVAQRGGRGCGRGDGRRYGGHVRARGASAVRLGARRAGLSRACTSIA